MWRYINPYGRETFGEDFLENRTVKGTFESVEYLTKKRVFFSKSRKRKFDDRAFIISEKDYKKLYKDETKDINGESKKIKSEKEILAEEAVKALETAPTENKPKVKTKRLKQNNKRK